MKQQIMIGMSKGSMYGSVPAVVTSRAGDTGSCIIEAAVHDGSPYNLTGMTAKFECLKPDKTFVQDSHVTISANTITYTVSREATSVSGDIAAYFRLYKGGTYVDSTESFVIHAAFDATQDGKSASDTYISDIEELLALMEKQKQDFEKAEADRISAETKRKTNETDRVLSEGFRHEAELNRVIESDRAVQGADDATKRAQKACDSVQGKVSEAVTAAADAKDIADSVRADANAGKFDGKKGDSGIVTQVSSGLFGLSINSVGRLIVTHNDGEQPPSLSMENNGHLVYEIS